MHPILVVAATPREIQPFRDLCGSHAQLSFRFLVSGVGKIASALASRDALLEFEPRAVVQIGCAGAFAGQELSVGDVVLATEEILADEGVDTPDGFLTLEALGWPVARRGGTAIHHRVPVSAPSQPLCAELQRQAGGRFRVAAGPLATVSTGSGTENLAREIAERGRPLAETMEGAAVAAVAWKAAVPFIEARGISNMTGNRDLSTWDIDSACLNAARVARSWLRVADPSLKRLKRRGS